MWSQVMLLENATLVLAASDILTEASWESLTVPTAILCSFLLGESTSHTLFLQSQVHVLSGSESAVNK